MSPATCELTAWDSTDGCVLASVVRSGACTDCSRYGRISVPLLAIAAASMASCSGVAWSSNCPLELRAGKDLSVTRGTTLAETGIGIVSVESFQPNLVAYCCSVGPPTFMPMLANAVLQDR